MKKWERRADESEKAYAAFKMYLDMENRSLSKLAENLSKSRQSLQQWAAKFDWKNRAAAWDSELLRQLQQKILGRYVKFLERQWKIDERLQLQIEKILEEKDMSKISWKSLNEMHRANMIEINNIIEILNAYKESADSNITINITAAEKPESVKGDDDK